MNSSAATSRAARPVHSSAATRASICVSPAFRRALSTACNPAARSAARLCKVRQMLFKLTAPSTPPAATTAAATHSPPPNPSRATIAMNGPQHHTANTVSSSVGIANPNEVQRCAARNAASISQDAPARTSIGAVNSAWASGAAAPEPPVAHRQHRAAPPTRLATPHDRLEGRRASRRHAHIRQAAHAQATTTQAATAGGMRDTLEASTRVQAPA